MMRAAMLAILSRRRFLLTALCCALLGTGCGGSGGSAAASAGDGNPTATTADITVLMMGNSHTSVADLPQQLGTMLRAGLPGKTVAVVVAPGWMYLEDHVSDPTTMGLLRSQNWTAVVLQAQKYSTSGLYSYSTAGAVTLVQDARRQKALPVMFPEWPRLGVDETQRIYDLHVSIAQQRPACVAPIGQAWDLARQRHPELRLHDSDGNHAAVPGAYLTALVLYASITGASPRALPDQDNGVAPAVQQQLRQVAADTVQAVSARKHCPGDQPLQ